jgi:peptidoglycan/LPS O-acetylase OafA/YrhL
MNNSDARFAKRWGCARQQGQSRFIFVQGGILWGVPMGIVPYLIRDFINQNENTSIAEFLLRVFFFFSIGLLIGIWRWESSERRFARLKKS